MPPKANRDLGRIHIPPGFPKEENYHLPTPPEPYYDLWILPDPPDDEHVVFNRPWKTLYNDRKLTKIALNTLIAHHFWGIDWTRNSSGTRESIIKGFYKLFWHMPEHNRPKNFTEFFDLRRDAGPRLLGYTERFPEHAFAADASPFGRGTIMTFEQAIAALDKPITPPLPVSIQHPNMPPPIIAGAVYNPPFQMPFEAGILNMIPSHVRQYLFPLYRDALPENPWEPMSPGETVQVPVQPPGFREAHEQRDESEQLYRYPALPKIRHSTQLEVTEELMKSLMKLTYHEIQRHPSAPSRKSVATRIAISAEDLDIIQVGLYPSTSEVKIDLETVDISPNGKLYSYRGRGPVGSSGSASLDTVIVLGMLTEAGCTYIDRYSKRPIYFDDLEKSFIETINMNWDCMSAELSKELRDSFFRKIHIAYPALGMGQILPPWALWAKLTRNFAQFQYTCRDRFHYCTCEMRNSEDSSLTVGGTMLPPFQPEDRNGVTPATLVSRKLSVKQHWGCNFCQLIRGSGRMTERVVERLPARLALITHPETRLLNHTETFQFEYRDEHGQNVVGTYRWLGGIYYFEERLRVYWTEAEPGRVDPETIRAYDPMSTTGVIAGSIPVGGNGPIPAEWLQSTIPLLIYEKVIDVPKQTLLFHERQITSMLRHISDNRPAITNYRIPTRKVHAGVKGVTKRLPNLGDRYFHVPRPNAGAQLELDYFAGNSLLNLYSMMKTNPFHPSVEPLFEAIAKTKLPTFQPGVPPKVPPYPLPDPPYIFESTLCNPEGFFDDTQSWSMEPLEVDETAMVSHERPPEQLQGDEDEQSQPEIVTTIECRVQKVWTIKHFWRCAHAWYLVRLGAQEEAI
ncbi:hypothetical protein PENSTE_c018G04657 [Penicillium steckii]|uniref:Uncharacterized protein n=1 Tax=Penicillium steckii TaxID=303698 RepID=A0A1V6SWC3_9EURO|nr:hypothetical protein PENSTE_c018G04657 [Penicillium steckii]